MAKYLVTGAAGFIGSNLVRVLLDRGETVIGLDNLSNGFRHNLTYATDHKNNDLFTFIEGDIRDLSTCFRAAEGVDYILHQAALGSVPRSLTDPVLYDDNNIRGTLNMLEAAKKVKVKRFVFASSSSAYGDTPTLPKIETMIPRPKSPYAVNKVVGEYYCNVYWEQFQVPTIAFRYFNIFGPQQDPNSQYSAVIPLFVGASYRNESPIIFSDGNQTRDFTYIDNVIHANLNACYIDTKYCGEVFNIGCGDRISVNELASSIMDIMGKSIECDYRPARAGDVRDSLASIEKARKAGIIEHTVDWQDGLKQTVEWFLSSDILKCN